MLIHKNIVHSSAIYSMLFEFVSNLRLLLLLQNRYKSIRIPKFPQKLSSGCHGECLRFIKAVDRETPAEQMEYLTGAKVSYCKQTYEPEK